MSQKRKSYTKRGMIEKANMMESIALSSYPIQSDFTFKMFGDPDNFCTNMLEFDSFGYQSKFLRDTSKRQCIVWARQSGKSTSVAAKSIYWAMRPKKTILVLAPTQRQSSLLFQKIMNLIKGSAQLLYAVERMTQTMIEFKNGSTLYSLPAGDGTGIRGFSAHFIIIDEAAFIREGVLASITPMMATTDGTLILMGTPFGKQGVLWDAYSNSSFSVSHVTAYDNPLIPPEFLESERKRLTDIEFKQEYLSEFIEGLNSYFPHDLLFGNTAKHWKGVVQDFEPERKAREGYEYYLGVDFARQGQDDAVFLVIENNYQGIPRVVWLEETQQHRLTDAVGRVLELDKVFNFRAIFLDETGLGSGPTDMLYETKLRMKIMPIIMNQQSKENLYTNLRKLFEDSKLVIPSHKKLVFQLKNLNYEYRSNGRLSFHHAEERLHDDYPDALCLAAWGLNRENIPLTTGFGKTNIAEKYNEQKMRQAIQPAGLNEQPLLDKLWEAK